MKKGDWIQPKGTKSLLNYLEIKNIPHKEITLFLITRFKIITVYSNSDVFIEFKNTQLSECKHAFNPGLWLLKEEYKESVGQMLLFDLTDTDSTDDITVNE